MAPERRNDDPAAFLERKHKTKQPSPLSQGIHITDDEHDDGTDRDTRSFVEAEDGSGAADRWQELKAAKTEEEEIQRFNREQTKALTKSEREHNVALHEVRMKRMQARKAGREAEHKAQEAAKKVALNFNMSTKTNNGKD